MKPQVECLTACSSSSAAWRSSPTMRRTCRPSESVRSIPYETPFLSVTQYTPRERPFRIGGMEIALNNRNFVGTNSVDERRRRQVTRGKSLGLVSFLLAWSAICALPASAEWFAGAYIGVALPQNQALDITVPGDVFALDDVDFDSSFTFGGRGGYWFETPFFGHLNVGVGLDVSYFTPDIDVQIVSGTDNGVPGTFLLLPIDVSVTPISFDLMLRYQLLTSTEFPKGQLQPYLTVGPTLFIASAEDTANFFPLNQDDTDTSIGFKIGTGLAWFFTKNVAAFGEYRFTHFSPEFEFTFAGAPVTVDTDANTHNFVAGMSYHF